MKKVKRYIKPEVTSKKVKISFFLSKVFWVDNFNLVGDVYAQSGGCAAASDCASNDCGFGCNCDSTCGEADCSGCSCSDCGCGECASDCAP